MASRSALPNLRDGLRENVLWMTLMDVILDTELCGAGDDGKDEGGEEADRRDIGDPGGGVDDDDDEVEEDLTSGIPRVSDNAVQSFATEFVLEFSWCSPDSFLPSRSSN